MSSAVISLDTEPVSSIPTKANEVVYLTADGSPKTSFQAVCSSLVNSLVTVGIVGSNSEPLSVYGFNSVTSIVGRGD